VCTPRRPACGICPWMTECAGRRQGVAETLPRRGEKAERPQRHGVAFWIVRRDGAVLLRRRAESGLLGGMMEVPSTPWRETAWTLSEAVPLAPLPIADWLELPGVVRHTFTHFHLSLTLAVGHAGRRSDVRGVWLPLDRLEEQALPTVMRKIVTHALRTGYRVPEPASST
ncbi:MAG: NUDIX domain-containing protein, partial [Alphaproteobacteria bacterium]